MSECERASWELGDFFVSLATRFFLSLSLSGFQREEKKKEKTNTNLNMSGRPEPPAAKRPRSSRPGSASSGSGGKLGDAGIGLVGGTAHAAAKSKLMEFGRLVSQKAIDSASTTPPALFFYSNLHDAVRAELQALLRSVSDASRPESSAAEGGNVDGSKGVDVGVETTTNASDSLPQTARARALADVANRARLLERVHAYHSAVEDEVKIGGMRRERPSF